MSTEAGAREMNFGLCCHYGAQNPEGQLVVYLVLPSMQCCPAALPSCVVLHDVHPKNRKLCQWWPANK